MKGLQVKSGGERRRAAVLIGLAALGLAAGVFLAGFRFDDNDYFFRLSKSIEILGRVYKEVAVNYVDEIEPEKLGEAGIDGLLGSLDPYTNFIGEAEGDEVELITSGKYGGVGVSIGVRDGFITILSVMEGYSAQRSGLLPGDRLLEVDGKPVTGNRPSDVRAMTRGEVGTELHIKVDREGEPEPLTFVVVREEIQLKNITYADCIGGGIAYVKLERFSRSAGDELRLAIRDLRLRDTIRGFILDLRDNPGGLLDAAVEVVEKFVPRGSLIVSTRGRKPDSEKKYVSTEEPMLPEVPMVVLVNKGSASASEIVAGAIQDLDRGVIAGTRSFGKGLVQTIVPIAYNTQLKITTAKYYTPSGRCIQEIDYAHRDSDGAAGVIPDSLRREFRTPKGRIVYESGGIMPDILVEAGEPGLLQRELLRRAMYVKFAARYFSEHKTGGALPLDHLLLEEFKGFLAAQKFTWENEAEKKLGELEEIALKSDPSPAVIDELAKLKGSLQEAKKEEIGRNWDEVLRSIKMELMSRQAGEAARIAASIENDDQFDAALGILSSTRIYSRLLITDLH